MRQRSSISVYVAMEQRPAADEFWRWHEDEPMSSTSEGTSFHRGGAANECKQQKNQGRVKRCVPAVGTDSSGYSSFIVAGRRC